MQGRTLLEGEGGLRGTDGAGGVAGGGIAGADQTVYPAGGRGGGVGGLALVVIDQSWHLRVM